MYGDQFGEFVWRHWGSMICTCLPDRTKNVCRATANSTCQAPLHVPCAIQAGSLKKGGGAIFFPAPRFPCIFDLEPNHCMLAIITRVGAGTPGNSWWGLATRFSREILTVFQVKRKSFFAPVFRPGLEEIMSSLLRLEQ